ncbi:MAG: nucleoside triphosphate pyrophosphohydrolase [Desulfobacterales bacterium]|nr:nucleoside triphosphate pyrophosphohydrolase [Desulfobacterales bacterium]
MGKSEIASTPVSSDLNSLIQLIKKLRSENGCPWDKKQTAKSMVIFLIEEVFELLDSIESENHEHICEELGDVLFHIFFIAELFTEKSLFNIGDVAKSNVEKMIRRHPHVFGQDKVDDADEVLRRWEKIKAKEKGQEKRKSILDSVPYSLPALVRAYRVSEKAAKSGFDWEDIEGVMKKTEEEWGELKSALNGQEKDEISLELGDVLFTLTNVARFLNIHPETALTGSIQKFEKRFRHMEDLVLKSNKKIDSISSGELNTLWEESKRFIDLNNN